MKAILLGAGYATRLYPLTKNRAKPLLEVSGKTITDHIVEKNVDVPAIDGIVTVTNDKFVYQFEEWVNTADYDIKLTVVNDGTLSNDTHLVAIGDIQFVIEQENITDDLMILAGDNLFEFSLGDFAKFAKEKDIDAIAIYEEENLAQLQRSGVAEIDTDSKKIIGFEGKPITPKSNLSVPVSYMFTTQSLPLIKQYLNEGLNPDALGNFITYLVQCKDTHAYVFEGKGYDIGTIESYEKVQKNFENK